MSGIPTTVVIPLATDAYGAIRVRGTRVLLDVIMAALQFPSAALSDVDLIIAHYLTQTAEIDAYL